MGKIPDISYWQGYVAFSQATKAETDYIIHRRIMQAQLLFSSSHNSVKEVAVLVGYDNTSYFGRTFKRIVGISPMDFIRQNR